MGLLRCGESQSPSRRARKCVSRTRCVSFQSDILVKDYYCTRSSYFIMPKRKDELDLSNHTDMLCGDLCL